MGNSSDDWFKMMQEEDRAKFEELFNKNKVFQFHCGMSLNTGAFPQKYLPDFSRFEQIPMSWEALKEFSGYETDKIGGMHNQLQEKENALQFKIDEEKGKIHLKNNESSLYQYKVLEFSYSCSSKVRAWKGDDFYPYENDGPVWKMQEALLIFDVTKEHYLLIRIKQGRIYSFKENNKLKIRCIISNEDTEHHYPKAHCIDFKQLIEKENIADEFNF